MSLNAAEVREALLALDTGERASVIRDALESLEPSPEQQRDSELSEAWSREIKKRVDEIESGSVELLDSEEVFARIRAELGTKER